jgi:5-methylcytosine-specific restriction endonuclease McrA
MGHCLKCGIPLTSENKCALLKRCKPCDNARKRKYAKKNAERGKRWAEANRERHLENCRRIARKHYHAHKHEPGRSELNRAKALAWSRAHPGVVLARVKTWTKANRKHVNETLQQSSQRRRARLRGLRSTLTNEEWADIRKWFGNACAYCLCTDRPLHIEHVIPVANGGEHTAENVVPACDRCNGRKGARSIFVMLKYL